MNRTLDSGAVQVGFGNHSVQANAISVTAINLEPFRGYGRVGCEVKRFQALALLMERAALKLRIVAVRPSHQLFGPQATGVFEWHGFSFPLEFSIGFFWAQTCIGLTERPLMDRIFSGQLRRDEFCVPERESISAQKSNVNPVMNAIRVVGVFQQVVSPESNAIGALRDLPTQTYDSAAPFVARQVDKSNVFSGVESVRHGGNFRFVQTSVWQQFRPSNRTPGGLNTQALPNSFNSVRTALINGGSAFCVTFHTVATFTVAYP